MKYFDVLLVSLSYTGRTNVTRWVRNIQAASIIQACEIAKSMHPTLGVTPTEVSMVWPLHPQPKS